MVWIGGLFRGEGSMHGVWVRVRVLAKECAISHIFFCAAKNLGVSQTRTGICSLHESDRTALGNDEDEAHDEDSDSEDEQRARAQ